MITFTRNKATQLNMKLLKYTLFVFLFCSAHINLQAQDQQQTINDGSIADQFDFVIKKSTNWSDEKGQSYEVIRRNMMLTLKTHAVDTINAIKARLENTRNTVNTQQTEINTLKTNLSDTEDQLAATNKEKDSMVFLGMQMSKASYSTLLWSIIAGLVAGLAFFIFRFKNSNIVTKETKSALAEMENEFKEHRRVALEREQKVKRELQDMINKYEA